MPLRRAPRPARRGRPITAAIAPGRSRLDLGHQPPAHAHEPHPVLERERARGDGGRVLAEAVAGDEVGPQPGLARDLVHRQREREQRRLGRRSSRSATRAALRATGRGWAAPTPRPRCRGTCRRHPARAAARSAPMPTFCEPCPGKRNASLPILHLLDLSRSYRRRPSISHGAPAGLSPAVAPARLLVTRCVPDGFLPAAVAAGPGASSTPIPVFSRRPDVPGRERPAADHRSERPDLAGRRGAAAAQDQVLRPLPGRLAARARSRPGPALAREIRSPHPPRAGDGETGAQA